MSKILFYDTETTGLPLFKERSDDPRQPHIVQCAAALVDSETRAVLASMNLVAKPIGWTIPDEVAAIHGITTERAEAIGVNETTVLLALLGLWAQADVRVGHNESFDARIVRIAIKRLLGDDELADRWKDGAAECTERMATTIMKMAPTARMNGGNKMPKLAEAVEFFLGRELVGAHSAEADCVACMDVYFAIRDREAGAASASSTVVTVDQATADAITANRPTP